MRTGGLIRVAAGEKPSGEVLEILGVAVPLVSEVDPDKDLLECGHRSLRLIVIAGETLSQASVSYVEMLGCRICADRRPRRLLHVNASST